MSQHKNVSFLNDLVPQMKKIAQMAVKSVYSSMSSQSLDHTFEVKASILDFRSRFHD
jgi:hypothetical protein